MLAPHELPIFGQILPTAKPAPGARISWSREGAAGQAVLEVAGGSVLDLDGSRLGYGKPNLKNAGFLA